MKKMITNFETAAIIYRNTKNDIIGTAKNTLVKILTENEECGSFEGEIECIYITNYSDIDVFSIDKVRCNNDKDIYVLSTSGFEYKLEYLEVADIINITEQVINLYNLKQ